MKNTGTSNVLCRASALGVAVLMLIASLGGGCAKTDVDQALDSDANGYVCLSCKAKFYTARKVFATRCPDCKKQTVEQAMGFICGADKQMTIGLRSSRSVSCKQCGVNTAALAIPREADFKTWGASSKTEAEVTGQ